MRDEKLNLEVITERPIVRKDQISDIDIAIDLTTNRSPEATSSSYAINLCVVIDRSGSMEGSKLEQAKKGAIDIYRSLNSSDKFSVLAFDDEVVSIANPQTPRGQVVERIEALKTGGMTNLANGWYLGLMELQTYSTEEHINRLVILSDGQANAGEDKPSVLGGESSRARDELGITTSAIGVGKDFQEDILAAISSESGGRFWFIDEARIEDIIKEEFSGALSVFLERPKIELRLPKGVVVSRELNDLPRISNRYRIRPIKGNDRFCFAARLRVDPAKVGQEDLPISATLYDGAGVVKESETVVRLGTIEELVQSPEDPRVAMMVSKYLAATSDEEILEKIDEGNVTTMLVMLKDQAELMAKIEKKLAGVSTIAWEDMGDKEAANRRHQEHELARFRMEIAENSALSSVGQLVDIMQGLGEQERALSLLRHGRKMHRQRHERNAAEMGRGEMDDWSANYLCRLALEIIDDLIGKYPDLKSALTAIQGKINEQLEVFS